MKLIKVFSLMVIFCLSQSASADVCFSGSGNSFAAQGSQSPMNAFAASDNLYSMELLQPASFGGAITCQQKEVFREGLEVASMLLNAGSLYAACTGAIPIILKLEAATLVVEAVDIVVSHIPCTGDESDEEIKAMVDEDICVALTENGVECKTPIYQAPF